MAADDVRKSFASNIYVELIMVRSVCGSEKHHIANKVVLFFT